MVFEKQQPLQQQQQQQQQQQAPGHTTCRRGLSGVVTTVGSRAGKSWQWQ
jgi:hypothetical protein